jgi:hypothetical protein
VGRHPSAQHLIAVQAQRGRAVGGHPCAAVARSPCSAGGAASPAPARPAPAAPAPSLALEPAAQQAQQQQRRLLLGQPPAGRGSSGCGTASRPQAAAAAAAAAGAAVRRAQARACWALRPSPYPRTAPRPVAHLLLRSPARAVAAGVAASAPCAAPPRGAAPPARRRRLRIRCAAGVTRRARRCAAGLHLLQGLRNRGQALPRPLGAAAGRWDCSGAAATSACRHARRDGPVRSFAGFSRQGGGLGFAARFGAPLAVILRVLHIRAGRGLAPRLQWRFWGLVHHIHGMPRTTPAAMARQLPTAGCQPGSVLW